MKAPRFTLWELLTSIFWMAVGLAGILLAQARLPPNPSLDGLARTLDLFGPLLAGASFGAAVGVLFKKQLACAVVGIAIAVIVFFVAQ